MENAILLLEKRDFSAVASLGTARSLQAFRDNTLDIAARWNRSAAGVEEVLARSIGVSDSLRQELLHQRQTYRDHPLPWSFSRASTMEELRAIPPEQLYARWLEATYLPDQMVQVYREAGRELAPGDTHTRRRRVLGSVYETPVLAHVLYREWDAGNDSEAGALHTISAELTPAGWLLILDDASFGSAEIVIGQLPGE